MLLSLPVTVQTRCDGSVPYTLADLKFDFYPCSGVYDTINNASGSYSDTVLSFAQFIPGYRTGA